MHNELGQSALCANRAIERDAAGACGQREAVSVGHVGLNHITKRDRSVRSRCIKQCIAIKCHGGVTVAKDQGTAASKRTSQRNPTSSRCREPAEREDIRPCIAQYKRAGVCQRRGSIAKRIGSTCDAKVVTASCQREASRDVQVASECDFAASHHCIDLQVCCVNRAAERGIAGVDQPQRAKIDAQVASHANRTRCVNGEIRRSAPGGARHAADRHCAAAAAADAQMRAVSQHDCTKRHRGGHG